MQAEHDGTEDTHVVASIFESCSDWNEVANPLHLSTVLQGKWWFRIFWSKTD